MRLRAMVLLLMLAVPVLCVAQNPCSFSLTGKVYDASSHSLLPFATVYVRQADKGAVSGSDGQFRVSSLCGGSYEVICTFLGYRPDTVFLTIQSDISRTFSLRPDPTAIREVEVTGQRPEEKVLASQAMTTISGQQLSQTRGATLGEALTGVTGVYVLQTGPTIFKPVIHGLHSNRVLILNNGVRQEGQQWGSEHAPEVDPFVASRLSVVKGAASIRYGSDAIGGVVSAEPAPLPSKPGMGGEVNLVGASNNRMGVASAILEGAFGKKLTGLSWRAQGTFRRAGNAATPHYYIENTGFQEINFSGALNWHHKNYGFESYVSRFDTRLGIFTGSESASIADQEQHIAQSRPSAPSYFTYAIARPFQLVTHTLVKTNAFYLFRNKSRMDVIFARQQNDRSEYDFTPLSGRNTPELFLKLVTHTVDAIYTFNSAHRYTASTGFNGITQGNVRMYEMLIPNFRNYGGGVFYLGKWTGNRLTLEGGVRYDYRWLRAYLLDNTTAQRITPTYRWQNVTGTAGAEYQFRENLTWDVNVGTAWRAPTVSELLSMGVHQSAADYEIGDPNLKLERAYNASTSFHYTGPKVSGEIGLYNNIIDGYIFLKPDGTFIHTVRGSLPSFTYTQVNARFRGVDFTLSVNVTDSLRLTTKESLLYAWNYTLHNYLQLVPANRFENSIRYGIGSLGKVRNLYALIAGVYTAKQDRVPPNSDFLAPPGGYLLVNVIIGCAVPVGGRQASVILSANNLMNVAYRDYMDRFRYYTDEAGRNFSLRLRVPFGRNATK